MSTGIQALTEREKETLRLLLWCHDAKSIARTQGLSVHTVNERLRDARRKLGVSSSREAARLLGETENWTPKNIGDNQFGVAEEGLDLPSRSVSDHRQRVRNALPWLIGGTLTMSLLVAAAILFSSGLGNTEGASDTQPVSTAAVVSPPQSAAAQSAREWVGLVDRSEWNQSWRSAGTLFKSQITASKWTATVEPVRKPLGSVSKRVLLTATKHPSLPGAPAGEYEIVEFKTDFAAKKDAVETVVLSREGSVWKVIGYFVR